jgi:hypothetical protein
MSSACCGYCYAALAASSDALGVAAQRRGAQQVASDEPGEHASA